MGCATASAAAQAEAPISFEVPSSNWRWLTGAQGFALVQAAHQSGQLLGRAELREVSWVLPHLAALVLALFRLRLALWCLVALAVGECVATFPRTANHAFLGVLAGLLGALVFDEDEERALACRSLVLIAFFWSGVQKLVHGCWFDGQQFAWLLVHREDVAVWVAPLLDRETASRLVTLAPLSAGAGPFRLDGVWLVASNLVWIARVVFKSTTVTVAPRPSEVRNE